MLEVGPIVDPVIHSVAAQWAPALHWPHLHYLNNPASSTDYWAPLVLGWQEPIMREEA